jgi:hypothetical protein
MAQCVGAIRSLCALIFLDDFREIKRHIKTRQGRFGDAMQMASNVARFVGTLSEIEE